MKYFKNSLLYSPNKIWGEGKVSNPLYLPSPFIFMIDILNNQEMLNITTFLIENSNHLWSPEEIQEIISIDIQNIEKILNKLEKNDIVFRLNTQYIINKQNEITKLIIKINKEKN